MPRQKSTPMFKPVSSTSETATSTASAAAAPEVLEYSTGILVKANPVLTKLELYNSGFPGSQFTREASIPKTQESSLPKLLGMGLLGALGGTGVAHWRGYSKGKGAAVGAALGLGGAWITDLALTKPVEPDVIAAITDDAGSSSIVVIGDKSYTQESSAAKKKAIATINERFTSNKIHRLKHPGTKLYPVGQERIHFPVVPLLLSNTDTKYPGWAGAILEHGILVQTAQMRYVYQHADDRSPCMFEPHRGWNLGSGSVVASVTGGYDSWIKSLGADQLYFNAPKANDTWDNYKLWTNRFVEWPSPAWNNTFGIGNHTIGNISSVGLGSMGYKSLQFALRDQIARSIHKFNGFQVTSTKQWAVGQGMADRYEKIMNPANLVNYIDNMRPYQHPYWDSDARQPEYWRRYNNMVKNAQWFVWAAEMLRLHSYKGAEHRPSWWVQHCTEWGVGCANSDRAVQKKLMTQYNSKAWCKDKDGNWLGNPMNVPLHWDAVEEYLKLVVENTPSPWTTRPNLQLQVSPNIPGISRMLLDIPDHALMGIMMPWDGIGMDYWKAIYSRVNGITAAKWLRVLTIVIAAVIEIVLLIFAQPLGDVMFAVLSCALALILMAIQRQQSGATTLSSQDIIAIVGRVVSTALECTDFSLENWVAGASGSFGSMLEDLRKYAEEAGIPDVLKSVADTYRNIEQESGWGYCDDFLATMQDVPSEYANSLGLDALNEDILNA